MSIKIALTGAAGLVGQNLLPRLEARGYTDLVALDKHPANTEILRRLHPNLQGYQRRHRKRRWLAKGGRQGRFSDRITLPNRRA